MEKSFNDFYENINRYFLKYENTIYCIDNIYEFAVMWNGDDWVKINCNDVPKGAKDISATTASKYASFPPWDIFKSLLKNLEQETKNYWETLIKNTTKKVIGYTNTSCGTDSFCLEENGCITNEEYAGIIKDFRENGYFYSGEDFQDSYYDCAPVLENYKCIDFSRRGFGGLIAKSFGDYSEMGYCNYTESMFIPSEKLKFPKGGRYGDIPCGSKEIVIDENVFNHFINDEVTKNDIWVAVPIPKDEKGFYWPNDKINLIYLDKVFETQVQGILCFANEENYNLHQKYRHLKFTQWKEEYANVPLLMLTLYKENFALVDEDFIDYY